MWWPTVLSIYLCVVLTLYGCRQAEQAPPAQEDPAALLGAVSVASGYAVVRIERVARIDRVGYRAVVTVEESLSGPLARGERVEIAWEELASRRPPRFSRNDQVLLALAPLSSTSLWLHRFPPQVRSKKIFSVAANGDAFVRSPGPASLDSLKNYVTLEPSVRAGIAGTRALAQIAALGEARLSVAALEILASSADDMQLQDPDVIDALTRALRHTEPTVRQSALSLVRKRSLRILREPVLHLARSHNDELAAQAWDALLSWRDPAIVEPAAAWAGDPREDWRILAARAAGSFALADLIEKLAVDPAPSVRRALAQSLAPIPDHLTRLLRLMDDRDESVRRAAATSAARVGPGAIPHLEDALSSGNSRYAAAALLALAEMGNTARPILERVAAEHPDESLRHFAALALGRPRPEH
ncbi:MAG: HEAT repeat domain-containing protein [Candidatus Binatia bacterium]|nr:HEAT repeat domain-containing protein [Candidatus Binatia bacterium]